MYGCYLIIHKRCFQLTSRLDGFTVKRWKLCFYLFVQTDLWWTLAHACQRSSSHYGSSAHRMLSAAPSSWIVGWKHIKDLSITFVQNDEVFTYTRRTLIVANILQKVIKLSTHTDALGFTLFPSVLSRDWSSDSRTCSCTIVSLNC